MSAFAHSFLVAYLGLSCLAASAAPPPDRVETLLHNSPAKSSGATVLAVGATDPAPNDNLAFGAPCSLSPRPNYQHCTDDHDALQLTDGKTTTSYFWTQQGTVGWQGAKYATVTVDLGREQPIAGVSLTAAAGKAGVTWPQVIWILTSSDRKTWHKAGELVALDQARNGPWPEGYAIRRLAADSLSTRGRYVQFLVIPLPGARFIFTDEVEVLRGPEQLLQTPARGDTASSADRIYQGQRLLRSIHHRFRSDAGGIRKAIGNAKFPGATGTPLLKRIDETLQACLADPIPEADAFRAVLPFSPAHARLFGVQADLWHAAGPKDGAVAWVPSTWEPLNPYDSPPAASTGHISVHTMRGEYRAAAVNLANRGQTPMRAQLRFEGLPGSPTPPCVAVSEALWTDTARGVPVASALPSASREGGAWQVTVLPGLVKQVWLTFHVPDLEAGTYRGNLLVESKNRPPIRLPVALRVWPLDFPERPTLWLGGWSYTNGDGRYGITPGNRTNLIRHLREHFVNAPWATSSVMRQFDFDPGASGGIRLDTREFDRWIADWPDARTYLVFLSVAHYAGTIQAGFGGAELGSPQFKHKVGIWISAWVKHLATKGVPANRLGLLIHDEPHEGTDVTALLAWARAIHNAEPDVLIWEDPTYRTPAEAPQELFAECDILCPNRPMWLAQGKSFAQFYRNQREQGRELQFYSCSGPARLLDPYSYYRLQAWHSWSVGATGSFFWAFGDNSGSSSWSEYFASRGPYTPVFLDATSVTAAKQMEAIRESVQDYEYFVMLQAAVNKARAGGRADNAMRDAEDLLKHAAREVLEAEGASGLQRADPKDRTVADAVRVKLLEALTALAP